MRWIYFDVSFNHLSGLSLIRLKPNRSHGIGPSLRIRIVKRLLCFPNSSPNDSASSSVVNSRSKKTSREFFSIICKRYIRDHLSKSNDVHGMCVSSTLFSKILWNWKCGFHHSFRIYFVGDCDTFGHWQIEKQKKTQANRSLPVPVSQFRSINS